VPAGLVLELLLSRELSREKCTAEVARGTDGAKDGAGVSPWWSHRCCRCGGEQRADLFRDSTGGLGTVVPGLDRYDHGAEGLD